MRGAHYALRAALRRAATVLGRRVCSVRSGVRGGRSSLAGCLARSTHKKKPRASARYGSNRYSAWVRGDDLVEAQAFVAVADVVRVVLCAFQFMSECAKWLQWTAITKFVCHEAPPLV